VSKWQVGANLFPEGRPGHWHSFGGIPGTKTPEGQYQPSCTLIIGNKDNYYGIFLGM